MLLHAFPGRAICELNLKPNFKEWAPYLGPFTRADDIVLNTEHRKINKGNGKLEEECREMSQERILEMLSNDSHLQIKRTSKRCKTSTAGSKIDIIMRFKRGMKKIKDSEIKDNVKKANDGTLSVSYPWMPSTGSTSKKVILKKMHIQ